MTTPSLLIRPATSADLGPILEWLERDFAYGEGFWGNRNLIEKGVEEEELFVGEAGGQVVAFLLGSARQMDILEVRPEARGNGFGRQMAQFGLERAAAVDAAVAEVECSPEESLLFWQRMGFRPYARPHDRSVRAWRPLTKTFPLAPEATRAAVRIEALPEDALYGEAAAPLAIHEPAAARQDGQIQLSQRVALFERPERGDLALRIIIDGHQLYFDKAKYPEAAKLGVSRDPKGCFYIDALRPD